MQVAGKENKKSYKDYKICNYQLHYKVMCFRDPWTSPADPPYFHGTRLEYQWYIRNGEAAVLLRFA